MLWLSSTGKFLYSAVSSPEYSLEHFTLHPNMTYLGSIQPCYIYCKKTIYQLLSVARYSFIRLSGLRQRGGNKITKASKWQQSDLNFCPVFKPSCYCAPSKVNIRKYFKFKYQFYWLLAQLPGIAWEKKQEHMTPCTAQSSFGRAVPMAMKSSFHKDLVQLLVS